jgi:hypothetical protein
MPAWFDNIPQQRAASDLAARAVNFILTMDDL